MVLAPASWLFVGMTEGVFIPKRTMFMEGLMRGLSTILCFVCVACTSLAVAATSPVGSVKTVDGQAFILREGGSVPAMVGDRVFEKDTLKTARNGSLAVVLRDDALLSLGPESEVVLDEFIFVPAEGKFSMIAKMLKGTAAYLSGLIVKLSPDSARVETPMGNIGFRGTKCLIRVGDN
jgi:hypothetical protein